MPRILMVIIGCLWLSLPTSASALSLNPISDHYVKPALDRVDRGLANLPGGSATNWNFLLSDKIRELSLVFLELIDTELNLVQQQRNLSRITPCLHLDLIILEEKIEQVRQQLKVAFREQRVFDITRLQSMVRFLNIRYDRLVTGGRNERYVDASFHDHFLFDPITWCCNLQSQACQEVDRETCLQGGGYALKNANECSALGCNPPVNPPDLPAVCPFHSDYLPPVSAGFGCDLAALDRVSSGNHDVIVAERDALEEFINKRNELLQNLQFVGGLTTSIAIALGQDPPDLSNFLADLDRQHLTRRGCSPTNDPDYNPPRQGQKPRPRWPEGAARWELRGLFAITPDQFQLIRGLYDLLFQWGEDREVALDLALPRDYPDGSPEQAEATARRNARDFATNLIYSYTRDFFKRWNRNQSIEDARILLQANDTQEQMTELLRPLRSSVREFSQLASQPDRGVRLFNTKFGFFLRRSCINRPCNKTLERMLRINLEDTCFPYTTGLYLDDPNHHITCRSNAGVGEEI